MLFLWLDFQACVQQLAKRTSVRLFLFYKNHSIQKKERII